MENKRKIMKDIFLFTIDKKEVYKSTFIYLYIFMFANFFSFLIYMGLLLYYGIPGFGMFIALTPKYFQEVVYGLVPGMDSLNSERAVLVGLFLMVLISISLVSLIIHFLYYFAKKKNYLGTAIFVIISIFWIASAVSNLMELR